MKSKKPQMLWTETQLWTHRTETVFFEEGSVITSKKSCIQLHDQEKKKPRLICRILAIHSCQPRIMKPLGCFTFPGPPGYPLSLLKIIPLWRGFTILVSSRLEVVLSCQTHIPMELSATFHRRRWPLPQPPNDQTVLSASPDAPPPKCSARLTRARAE